MANLIQRKSAWYRRRLLFNGGILLVAFMVLGAVSPPIIMSEDKLPVVVHAGPLETSFYKDIPKGISLGMSKESLISIMKREPDDSRIVNDDIELSSYLVDNFPIINDSAIGCAFVLNQLYSITMPTGRYCHSQKDFDDFDKLFAEYKSYLVSLYGQPRVLHHQYANARENVSEVFLWEFANNALVLFPITVESESFSAFGTVVSPLSESGLYDLSYGF